METEIDHSEASPSSSYLTFTFTEKLTLEADRHTLEKFIRESEYVRTVDEVSQRMPFEDALKQIYQNNKSLDEEKQAWLKYIDFEMKSKNEPQRARLLFERALISLDSDLHFWLEYVEFIQRVLKDNALVRAKFESKRTLIINTAPSQDPKRMNDLVELLLENALFEEEQS